MNVAQALVEGKKILKTSKASEYALDTELFIMKATGFSKVELFTQIEYKLKNIELEVFFECIEKRKNGVPTQYIIGKCEFMGLDFKVNQNVLIPRSDTEILAEEILKISKKKNFVNFLEIGTGSGCVSVSLCALSDMYATASDISDKSLYIAEENARMNNVYDKIKFIKSDIFQDISENILKNIDFIVSNPPYIPTGDIKSLMREVKDNEPLNALDGGYNGLYFYKRIISESCNFLKNNAYIFFEIGYNQAESVENMFKEHDFQNISVVKDLAGLDRVIYAEKLK